jgi:transposase
MSRYEVTDVAFSVIEPLLPGTPGGMPRVENRRVLGGSRGGLTTKDHARTDARCRRFEMISTPGQAGDRPLAE